MQPRGEQRSASADQHVLALQWNQAWQAEWAALLEGLWPSACAVCGALAADHVACERHALALDEALARCGLCSRALPTGIVVQRADPEPPWRTSGVRARRATWRRCRECRLQAPGYGRLLCLGDYGAALRPWVLALKHGRRTVALPLARLLAGRLRAAGWQAPRSAGVRIVLVPVPSHRWRRFERGADGPRALGKALGREMGWPVCTLLERVRFTTPQGEPGSVSRAGNVSGALRVPLGARVRLVLWMRCSMGFGSRLGFVVRAVRSRFNRLARLSTDAPIECAAQPRLVLLLVDDVVTSGATLAEAARALRKGLKDVAPQIGAISVARAQWGR